MKAVSVITRTQNRPLLLKRALESIKSQTYRNFVWVVVNDAGEKEDVDKIIVEARKSSIDANVIHRIKSIGMEAASNDGVRNSESEYIVIHDDDDSWEPDFLGLTVNFLENHPEYLGVITHTTRIDEEIKGNEIRELSRQPYNEWMLSVQLADMSLKNQFPPISFLFRRITYLSLGGFDETLPVLGDWDFHLRVLMEGDIGVVPVTLANYYFRAATGKPNDYYGNSITASVDKHAEYDAKYRNDKYRSDAKKGITGLGLLLVMGRKEQHVMDRFDTLDKFITLLRALSRKIPFAQHFLRKSS